MRAAEDIAVLRRALVRDVRLDEVDAAHSGQPVGLAVLRRKRETATLDVDGDNGLSVADRYCPVAITCSFS